MEDKGLSPAKIAVLAVILALFAGVGYFVTRPGASDTTKVAAVAAAPATTSSAAPADAPAQPGTPSTSTAAEPNAGNAASAPPEATQTAAASADQAVAAPAQATPPPPQAAATPQPAEATAPAPAENAPAAVANTSAPAPAPSSEVAQTAPESNDSNEHKSARSKTRSKGAPAALAVLTPWWNQNSAAFHVVAVGPASEKTGIVVVFSTDLKDPAAAAQQLHLEHNGKPVSGAWQPGTNNRVLALTDLTPGKYRLAIDGAVADASSQTLGNTKVGPVYVQ